MCLQTELPTEHYAPFSDCVLMLMAGGDGSRTGLNIPKQYYGKPSPLQQLMAQFYGKIPITVVHAIHHIQWIEPLQQQYPKAQFCIGGNSRHESVWAGLQSIENIQEKKILIHDAARPFADNDLFDRVINALNNGYDAVCPIVGVYDTVCKVQNNIWCDTIDRKSIKRVQTPQGFIGEKLKQSFSTTNFADFTDECSRMNAAGFMVYCIAGDDRNNKITTKNDVMAIKPTELRYITAFGFDVHAFDNDKDNITLCGVNLPSQFGLSGHSDADVALHALTDAILGSIALQDIGHHFPPTEDKWRGADSIIFLDFALKKLSERGGNLQHIDLTIIGEYPKISPNRQLYRDKLSQLCSINIDNVSVKATTTEKLGFLGRREGLAAQAVVTVCILHQH